MHSGKSFQLRKSLSLLRQFQIVNQLAKIVFEDFFAILVGLGIVGASSSGFVVIAMYNEFPLAVYVACSTLFFISQTVNFVLVYLGSKPMRNGIIFQQKFAHEAWSRQYRKELQSFPKQIGSLWKFPLEVLFEI